MTLTDSTWWHNLKEGLWTKYFADIFKSKSICYNIMNITIMKFNTGLDAYNKGKIAKSLIFIKIKMKERERKRERERERKKEREK